MQQPRLGDGDNRVGSEDSSLSDEALFEFVKQGDADALRAIYDRYAVKVYRIAKRMIPDEQAVQEVIQDVFTRIWTTHAFDASLGAFEHWFGVVARRVTIDHVRKRRHLPDTASPPPEMSTVCDDTEQLTSKRLLRRDLLTAMTKLDEDQRLVLHLAYFKGYTLSEIASIAGMPLGTVKTKLHKGLKAMRMELSDWGEEVQS